MMELYDEVVKNTTVTDVFTKEELKDAGFITIDNPCIQDNGVGWASVRRRIVKFTPKEKFDATITKQNIIDAIKQEGYTHVYKVDRVDCLFWFGNTQKLELEPAVCVMFSGFTKKD